MTHTYAVTGTYTVTLEVANACGQDVASHALGAVLPPRAAAAPGRAWGMLSHGR